LSPGRGTYLPTERTELSKTDVVNRALSLYEFIDTW
jgi:hypothetical protein